MGAETGPKSFGILFWLVAGAAEFFSFVFGMAGLFIVPRYEPALRNFGSDLPWGTDLVLATCQLWWPVMVIAAALWCYALRAPRGLQHRSRLLLAFGLLAIGSCAAIVLAFVALISPIDILGDPV